MCEWSIEYVQKVGVRTRLKSLHRVQKDRFEMEDLKV